MPNLSPSATLDPLKEVEARYAKIRPFAQGTGYWRTSFLRAATRLGTWMKCLAVNGRLDEWIQREQPATVEREWLPVLPAVRRLLEAADPDIRLTPIHEFLLDLNTELLDTESARLESKKDNNEIVRSLYSLLHEDRYALFAALALFDVHISDLDGRTFSGGYEKRALDLFPNVFIVLAEGLNLWALRRRWLRIYVECTQREGLAKFAEEYRLQVPFRDKVARELISAFKLEFSHPGFSARLYQPTLTSLYKAGLYESAAIEKVDLQVTCPDKKSCYAALCWFEERGPTESKYIHKSLFFPEANGATRLHTAIRYPTDDRLVVVRIGTSETQLNNEWGKLFQMLQNPHVDLFNPPKRTNRPLVNPILVYNTNGTEFRVERNSTVADFISQSYSPAEAQHCTGAYINATSATLGQTLLPGDVLRILIDPDGQDSLAPDEWGDNHLHPETRTIINQLKSKDKDRADHGKNRILIEMQKYLRRWNVAPDEKDLFPILAAVGKKITAANRDSVFRSLATDQSIDGLICKTALQYYLRGRILYADGTPIDLHWKDISLAGCCKPRPSDEIIGNAIEGPRDPANPRHGYKSIVVHSRSCRSGPASQNTVRLVWAPPAKDAAKSYGLRASFLLDDDRGALGQLLEIIYSRTSLALHFVHADAVNFGVQKAEIVLLGSATTAEEITEAINILDALPYRKTFKRLGVQETRVLLPSQEYCPYLLNIDPEMDKEIPIWITGRSRELSKLKMYINDPRINRIMIVGYYRSGKTWFLKHFKSTYSLPGHYTIYLSFDALPKKFDPQYLVYDMYTQILAQLPDRRFDTSTAQRPRTLPALTLWLQSICARNNCTINLLIDEFSVMNFWVAQGWIDPHFPEQFVRFMESTPCVNFVLVFQSAHITNLIADEDASQFVDFFRSHMGEEKIEMKPFTMAEMLDMLNGPVQEKYSVSDAAVELALRMTGGNPFLTAKLSRMLWETWDLERYSRVELADLKRIFLDSYTGDPDWNAFIGRITQKVPQAPLDLLKRVAQEQYDGWDDWPFANDRWVAEDPILRGFRWEYPHTDAAELVKKLVEVNFLQRQETSAGAQLRFCSGLLAFRLANKKVYRNVSAEG